MAFPAATRPFAVSLTRPVDQALERVTVLLFRPLDPGRWFVIGFSAWLAHLGMLGMPGTQGIRHRERPVGSAAEAWERLRQVAAAELPRLLPWILLGLLVALALAILLTWLSSRGRFMFLHCVVNNVAEVSLPWRVHAALADSLFRFRVVLGFVSVLLLALPFAALAALARAGTVPDERQVALGAAFFVVVLLALASVQVLLDAFVVPIMFLRRTSCASAWRELFGLMEVNAARFAGYLLFQVVLALGTGVMILGVVLGTCCVAGCFLMIPYVGAVLLLPALTFWRSYPLFYLAQYGPAYDIFRPPEPDEPDIVSAP